MLTPFCLSFFSRTNSVRSNDFHLHWRVCLCFRFAGCLRCNCQECLFKFLREYSFVRALRTISNIYSLPLNHWYIQILCSRPSWSSLHCWFKRNCCFLALSDRMTWPPFGTTVSVICSRITKLTRKHGILCKIKWVRRIIGEWWGELLLILFGCFWTERLLMRHLLF